MNLCTSAFCSATRGRPPCPRATVSRKPSRRPSCQRAPSPSICPRLVT
ncbi:hypothetical protein CSPAE12_07327 [Colletotrichum incanum]|nr:hypothetical protein CSPAE12_07327 [Colletotrichum incanum]